VSSDVVRIVTLPVTLAESAGLDAREIREFRPDCRRGGMAERSMAVVLKSSFDGKSDGQPTTSSAVRMRISRSNRRPAPWKESIGEASDLVNDLVERGRKRALDLFFTAYRYSNFPHRSVFTKRNVTFVGRQEDPALSALAPQFRWSKITYTDRRPLVNSASEDGSIAVNDLSGGRVAAWLLTGNDKSWLVVTPDGLLTTTTPRLEAVPLASRTLCKNLQDDRPTRASTDLNRRS